MQHRLDRTPQAASLRRETVEDIFGMLKAWMGSTHLLTRTLECLQAEMSLHVLAYNRKRLMSVIGVEGTIAAMKPSSKNWGTLQGNKLRLLVSNCKRSATRGALPHHCNMPATSRALSLHSFDALLPVKSGEADVLRASLPATSSKCVGPSLYPLLSSTFSARTSHGCKHNEVRHSLGHAVSITLV